MKKFTYIVSCLVFILGITFNSHSFAVKHVVLVGNFFFNPTSLNVTVGDTIRWVWSAGTHTTTSNPGGIPSGAASWDAPITSSVTTFEYKVTVAGAYAYVCTPHAPSMAGTFTATAPAPTLSVTPSNQNVPAISGSTTFDVMSNSSWTASSSETWCTVTSTGSGNGMITASYTANATSLIRMATITVSVTGLAPQMVTVTQAASSVGVKERILTDLQIFPNPTKGVFKLKAGNLKDQVLNVSLLDISGKTVLTRVCTGADEYTFDITLAPRGYYFIRVESGNDSQVRRIMLID
ncbi:MAG: T9SS type A sorting domain-containing protein [Bacteroidales bacterium]|nr:T9SS type A sorting domain-containing protein [Bacteroidales bacterium]